ncbi:MAG: hypothetical protein ACEPOV_14005 [Hyphomicrobiales bacterium]
MIKFIENHKIDKEKWDACIHKAFNGIVYAYSWYLDIVAGEWAALVEDDYERVMPLPIKSKHGIKYIIQPIFIQQLGVFSVSTLNDKIVKSFIDAIPTKYKFAQVNLNVHNNIFTDSFPILPRRNYELDLIQTYTRIYSLYSKNCKRNLKKAEKSKLEITRNIRPEKVIELFRKNKGLELKEQSEFHYMSLTRLLYESIYRGHCEVLGVINEFNEIIAGGAFLVSHHRIIFLFSGNNDEAKNKGAMSFLLDYCIKTNAGRDMVFDFEGSMDNNLARFYRGFGANETKYYQVVLNRFPFIIKQFINWIKKLPRK